ncbi:hypothetical protein DL768_010539 [Monosporascus sp. mg162]|nr:hypothetical protein DL768_010539 [Monosporascus sp. mg162]
MKRWAIIVGIDFYPSDRYLQGSVQDASSARHYLEETGELVDITLLTATTPRDSCARVPVENPASWPTQANVVAGLRRIVENASPGDLVYFHFSGHGVQVPDSAASAAPGAREAAIVLFENNEPGSSYLRGRHLARALGNMVGKGLVVTLVLDCCFSGGVTRHGDRRERNVRCLDYKADVDAASPQLFEGVFMNTTETMRHSRIEKDWLVDPDGYTIITACGPHETAQEIEVEGLGMRGALTYFLFKALQTLSFKSKNTSSKCLHEHLRTTFHASWPRQTPMRYGNKDRCFFSNLIVTPEPASFSIYKIDDGRLRLRAGRAHGILEGDEFSVCPFGGAVEATTEPWEALNPVLRAGAVGPFESDLAGIDPGYPVQRIATGWTARLLTSVSLRKVRVQLSASIGGKDEWEATGQKLNTQYLFMEASDEPCMFNVIVNEYEEYQVVDSRYDTIIGLPTVPLDSPGAISKVLHLLQHLAVYKCFEGLENRLADETFRKTFSITPHLAVTDSGGFSVNHGGTWGFTIENHCDKPLYMTIFNFNPSWEVVNMVSESGDDDYIIVPARKGGISSRKEMRLLMEVPESGRIAGKGQCEDVVKVFVTNRPISFPSVILPKMPVDPDSLHGAARGVNALSRVLLELSSSSRGDDQGEEQWTTQNFIICTTLE